MSQRIDRIGKFEIIESLGEGSLGEVFLARDTIIGREVVVRIVRRASLVPPDPLGRFMRESQAAGRLNHANVVTIHEFGEKGGMLYQVMDHVAGPDLGTAMQVGTLPSQEVLGLLAQVCDGLAYAHQRGMLHRNLKASNVRMGHAAGRPAPKLLDFGLSRTPVDDPAAQAAHLATLASTAPEAFQPGRADGRADLFSVGVLLYQALTGIHPFADVSPAAIAQRIQHEEPAPLDPLQYPELSPAIQELARKALAKDPARRFQTAEAMADALRAARNPAWSPDLEQIPSVATAKPFLLPGYPDPQPAQPRPWRTGLLVLVAVLALGALGTLGAQRGRNWLRSHPGWRPHLAFPTLHPAAQPGAQSAAAQPAAVQPPPMPHPVVPSPLQPPPAPAAPAPGATPAPAAVPGAPAPATPAPAAPASAAKGYASLDQAADALDQDPLGALGFLETATAREPGNERAAALRIVALYRLARYPACSKAIKEARDAGHPLWPMALNQPVLRRMLEQDAKDPHLPRRKPTPAPAPAAAPASPQD